MPRIELAPKALIGIKQLPWLRERDSPLRDGHRERAGDCPSGLARKPAHLARVLIVDDEHIIADTLRAILTLSGFNANAAYSGEQALVEIERHCPDIVLTDVRMAGRDGIETAVLIQQACPHIRVVLFSGQAGVPALVEEARRKGFGFELWSKPLHPKELVRRLRAL